MESLIELHSIVVGLRPAFSILARRIAFPLLLLAAGLVFVQPSAGAPFAFEDTGSLATARDFYTATLLPNGNVLAAGGGLNFEAMASAELYDPASGTWSTTQTLATARRIDTATLLLNGKVLVAGGDGQDEVVLASAEIYDLGLRFHGVAQPKIAAASFTSLTRRLQLKGSRFQGISQASGGDTQDSASSYPIAQLRSIDNSQVAFVPVDPASGWSDTNFTSRAVRHFPFGPALVTIFTNGIPSTACYLVIEQREQ